MNGKIDGVCMMKWIMVANSNDCRVYEYDKHIEELNLVAEINHPENKLKTYDLVTDRPGHFKAMSAARGSYEPEKNIHDISVENYVREMAELLNAARNRHDFDSLVLLMPSVIEGLLMKFLKKQNLYLIHQIIQKNMMHLSEHQLKQYLSRVIRHSSVLH